MVSVIICSNNEPKFAEALSHYTSLLAGEKHEIIRIKDATGLAEGYNRGLSASSGDVFIFSHDDMRFLAPDFASRLHGHLAYCDLLGVAGTTKLVSGRWTDAGLPHLFGQVAVPNPRGLIDVEIWDTPTRRVDGIKAVDGAFIRCKRAIAINIGFDQHTFRGFHLYDIDFSFRAHLVGYRLSVCSDLDAFHYSKGNFSSEDWKIDASKFIEKHRPHLEVPTVRYLRTGAVSVDNLSAAREVMRPPHWLAD